MAMAGNICRCGSLSAFRQQLNRRRSQIHDCEGRLTMRMRLERWLNPTESAAEGGVARRTFLKVSAAAVVACC